MDTLYWLPRHADIRQAIRDVKLIKAIDEQVSYLEEISKHQLDFNQINRIDRQLQHIVSAYPDSLSNLPGVKLAILASFTVEHLQSAIRVAGLRRGVIVQIYVAPYGQYRQELMEPNSKLYRFQPDIVLFALNNSEIGLNLSLDMSWQEVEENISNCVNEWEKLWQIVRDNFGAVVLQQTFMSQVERLFGNYDALIPASAVNIANLINQTIRKRAYSCKILLLDIDYIASSIGQSTLLDPTLWHHAKQAISPVQAPRYGDQVARVLAAIRGLSYKCLVLDLDNTLWGGIIGDDGLGGIEIGQGNGQGEAFQAFQKYVKSLKNRGIILAVCSKNNEPVAKEPFQKHPEMILRLEDFSAFIANWEDKATNLKRISDQLNIGIDSLVFFDDNPAERDIVRQFASEVAVPEIPEDPAWYVRCLSDAGYFEAISFSKDDVRRAEQYRENNQRNALLEKSHSIENFLKRLNMRLTVAPVDSISLQRATQLINRSNQFNLTTRRYTEAQVQQMTNSPNVLCLQMRLEDIFGDNGLISIVIAKPTTLLENKQGLYIDTWLMSCRVLGRQVEQEVVNIIVEKSRQQGANYLLGEYIQTSKNSMVKDHYAKLGFKKVSEKSDEHGRFCSLWHLDIDKFEPLQTFIESIQN